MAHRVVPGVDVAVDEEPPAAPADDDAPGTSAHRRAAALLSALVVVALLVGQTVLDHRARARLARLASVPGTVAPLGVELVELWRVGTQEAGVLALPALTVSRTEPALLLGRDETGAAVLQARDQTSGTTLWRTTLLDVPGDAYQRAGCEPMPGRRLVCLVLDYTGASGAETAASSTASRLVVVDLSDGSLLASHDVPAGDELAVVDGVAAIALVRGEAAVAGLDPLDGALLWTWEVPGQRAASSTVLMAVHGSFAVHDLVANTVTFLDTAGRVARTWGGSGATSMSFDGADLVAQVDGRVTSLGLDGDTELPGWPVTLAVDDGSAPVRLVRDDAELVALDPVGAPVWSTQAVVGDLRAVLLEGVLYLAVGAAQPAATVDGERIAGTLLALDATTGQVRWQRDVTALPSQLTTDGRSLVGLVGSQLMLWQLGNGMPVRELPPPTGVSTLGVVGSLVVGYDTGDTLVVLGSP